MDDKYTVKATTIEYSGQTEYRIANSDGEVSSSMFGDVRFIPLKGNYRKVAEITGQSFRLLSVGQVDAFIEALQLAKEQLKNTNE